jgi:hypothetical protein
VPISPLRQRPAYAALTEHHAKIEDRHLRDLFAEDPVRGERFSAEAAGPYLDYSKNRITEETLNLLLQLARKSKLERHRDMMFAGDRINVSERSSPNPLPDNNIRDTAHLGLHPPSPGCVVTWLCYRGFSGQSTWPLAGPHTAGENSTHHLPRFQRPGRARGGFAPMPVSHLRFYRAKFLFSGQCGIGGVDGDACVGEPFRGPSYPAGVVDTG